MTTNYIRVKWKQETPPPPPALLNLSSLESEEDTHGYEMPSNLQSPPPSVNILTINIIDDNEEAPQHIQHLKT